MLTLDHRGVHDAHGMIPRLENLLADIRQLQEGQIPFYNDLTDAPCLDRYRLAVRPEPCLTGHVCGHPTLGTRVIVTSGLWIFAPELGWARTLSRYYRLDRPVFGSEES